MKREIKFRAWIPNTGWLAEGFSIAMDGTEWYDDNGHSWPVCDLEVMQFTGLQDKNGKEIYEGDIVTTGTDKAMIVGWSERHASFVIERDGWMFGHYFGEAFESNECEVIGNIYENPELLN